MAGGDGEAGRSDEPRAGRALGALLVLILLTGLVCGVTANVWLLNQQLETRRGADRERQFWVIYHDEAGTSERTAAFLQLVAAGNREWLGARLARLDLSNVNLSGRSLQLVDLEGASLDHANLSGADLYRSLLKTVDLTEANLQRAQIVESDLLRATLNEANLREANLSGSSLDQASVRAATLVLADLSEARLSLADFTDSDFTGCNLTDANFEGAVLRGANLALAKMSGVNLQDADLTNANWWRAKGLTPDQLAALRKDFAPGNSAPDSLRSDFRLWAGIGDDESE